MTCACAPLARCLPCRKRSRATGLLMSAASDRKTLDPVAYWDRQTSLADARTALCLAVGVPAGRIHPASGHDIGRTA